jgi:hypothetical protein
MTSRAAATSNAPIQNQSKGPENQPRDSRCVKDPIHPKNKGRTADSRAIWKGRQRVARSRIAKSGLPPLSPVNAPVATCQVCAIRQMPRHATARTYDRIAHREEELGRKSEPGRPRPRRPAKSPPEEKTECDPAMGRWRVESQRRRVAFARPHSLGNGYLI